MINTQYINLNMVPSGVMPMLYCSQYDIGRPLGMVVYNGGEAVDLDGYTCTIEATRTDGTAITAAVTTDDNIGVFETTATMTNQADTYKAKFVIVDGNGKRVASLAFVLCVTAATMDENSEEIEEDASLYQQYTGTVQTIIAAIRADLAAEITARQNAVSAEATARQNAIIAEANARAAAVSAEAAARQSADNTLQSNINAEASSRATTDASLQAQIDQLIAPSGSAPSAAEVENARIGSDGTVYPTLGDAIRTQNSDLKNALDYITVETRNLLDMRYLAIGKAWNGATSKDRAVFIVPLEGGSKYAITFENGANVNIFEKIDASSTSAIYGSQIQSGYKRTSDASATVLVVQFSKTDITFNDVVSYHPQMEVGSEITEFIPSPIACDYEVRENLESFTESASINFDYISSKTRNIADIKKQLKIGYTWAGFNNADRATCVIPIRSNAQYALSVSGGSFDGIYVAEKVSWADTTDLYGTTITDTLIRTSDASATVLAVQFAKTGISAADFDNVQLQVEYGGMVSPYIEPISAYDRVARDDLITWVTPEMYGAWADGVHDDTVALQTALDSGKNVVANGKYLITDTINMTSAEGSGQKFRFNTIVCNTSRTALTVNGRNGFIDGLYLESNGVALHVGNSALTYDWKIHISMIKSNGDAGIIFGGPAAVSEITIDAEFIRYWASGVYFDLSQYWVGQVVFYNMVFTTSNPNANYAFFANGVSHPLTGITCINVSLEGAHGGFNFVNSQAPHAIETLNCFGLRTGEMSILKGYPVLRYTGSGVLRGKMILDICDYATAFDVSGAYMRPCFTVEGRINDNGTIYGMLVGNGTVMSPVVFPIAS